MANMPRVHEIFSNSALNKNNVFMFEQQESKQKFQLGKKKEMAPVQVMKKFGGYKPKILGGQTDFLPLNPDTTNDDATLYAKTSPDAVPDVLPDRPSPRLTKPRPWVIGDKDVPMVLSTVSDNVDNNDKNNNVSRTIDDTHLYDTFIENDDQVIRTNGLTESLRKFSLSSETSTLISEHQDEQRQGIDNPALYANGSLSSEDAHTSPSHRAVTDNPLFDDPSATDNSVKSNSIFLTLENGVPESAVTAQQEPEGVFIPDPDYEEDEQTLDFTSEDTDDPSDGEKVQRSKVKQSKPRPVSVVKEYAGEDLSHYLSDDEADTPEVVYRHPEKARKSSNSGKKAKAETQRPRLSERHSLFKTQTQPKSKRKGSGKGMPSGFNSVRNFSYADSKFGTMGKGASKSLNNTFTVYDDDSEKFLRATNHQSAYESFLRTRHGNAMPPPESSDSGVDMGDDVTYARLRHKDEPVWKKFTLRLKRMSKGYSVDQH